MAKSFLDKVKSILAVTPTRDFVSARSRGVGRGGGGTRGGECRGRRSRRGMLATRGFVARVAG